MTLTKNALLGAAVALGVTAGTGASALTSITQVVNTGDMNVTIGGTSDTTVMFDWLNITDRAAGFVRFTVDTTFDLVLDAYTGGGDGSGESSGYVFGEDGVAILTTDSMACEFRYDTCNFVSNDSSEGLLGAGDTLFSDLAAGSYYLGFEEFASQDTGTATFSIVEASTPAPIPLPAGGWLLIGALGGLGALRARRKKADA